jgi:hypothetical protein
MLTLSTSTTLQNFFRIQFYELLLGRHANFLDSLRLLPPPAAAVKGGFNFAAAARMGKAVRPLSSAIDAVTSARQILAPCISQLQGPTYVDFSLIK